MQRTKLTQVKLLFINGVQLSNVTKLPEGGYEEEMIEVATPGQTVGIGSGQEKLTALELEFNIFRDSPELGYFMDWRSSGKEGRDVVIIHTDKTGDIANWFFRDIYPSCELLDFKTPAFEQAARKQALLTIKLAPGGYSHNKR